MLSITAKVVLLLFSSLDLVKAFDYQIPMQPMVNRRSKAMKLTWVPVVEPSDLRSAGSVVIGVRQAGLGPLGPHIGPEGFLEQGPYGMDSSLGAAAEGHKIVVPAPIMQKPEPIRNMGRSQGNKPILIQTSSSSNVRTTTNNQAQNYERRPALGVIKENNQQVLPPPAIQSSESVRSRDSTPVQNAVPIRQDSYNGKENSADNHAPQQIQHQEKEYVGRQRPNDGYRSDEAHRDDYERGPHRDHHHYHHHHPHDKHVYEDHLHDEFIDPHELAQTGHAYAEELAKMFGDDFEDDYHYHHSKVPYKYGGKSHSSRPKQKDYHRSKQVAPQRETYGDQHKPSKAANQEYEKRIPHRPIQSQSNAGQEYRESNPSTENTRVQNQADNFNAQIEENVRYVARPPPPPPGLTQYRVESQGRSQVVAVPPPRTVNAPPQRNEVPRGYDNRNDDRIKINAQGLPNDANGYVGRPISKPIPTRIEDNRNYQLSSSQNPLIQTVDNSYVQQENDYRRPNDDTQQEVPIDLRSLDRGTQVSGQNYVQANRYETPPDQGRYETAKVDSMPRLANRNQGYGQVRQSSPPDQTPLVVVNNGEAGNPTTAARYESSTVSNAEPDIDVPNPQMLIIRTPPRGTTGNVYEGVPRQAGERYSNADEDAPEIDLRSGHSDIHEGGNGYDENHPHSGLGVGIGFLDDAEDDEENDGEPQYKK